MLRISTKVAVKEGGQCGGRALMVHPEWQPGKPRQVWLEAWLPQPPPTIHQVVGMEYLAFYNMQSFLKCG